MRDVILIRHCESEKNVANRLSSEGGGEPLTPAGAEHARRLGVLLAERFTGKRTQVSLHCASSRRGVETMEGIRASFGETEMSIHEDLKSTRAGVFAGVSACDLKMADPKLSFYLTLYEAGLLNLYVRDRNIPLRGKEPKPEYEQRVWNCLEEILGSRTQNTLVIVAHKAAITAILIGVARQMGLYPSDHYGHVPIRLGAISWLTLDGSEWFVRCVNSQSLEE